jgi:hypothetical protein
VTSRARGRRSTIARRARGKVIEDVAIKSQESNHKLCARLPERCSAARRAAYLAPTEFFR